MGLANEVSPLHDFQPNILFIVADQHNAKVLGHKGYPDARTPDLDRMARDGCRFD